MKPDDRLWVHPYTGKERLVIHDDPAKCMHGGPLAGPFVDEVCEECCVCNAHSGCGCCACPWGLDPFKVAPPEPLSEQADGAP